MDKCIEQKAKSVKKQVEDVVIIVESKTEIVIDKTKKNTAKLADGMKKKAK